ncbi:MAG: GNAT family N-acetyltransferase [Clostridia bacterium]|nr:GNAT family N-acetyltransferase [Clostridia bacterium]
MYNIRLARNEDMPAVRSLWCEAFGGDEPYTSWYFREIYRPERTFSLCEAGQIVSCMQYAPYILSLHGRRLPVAYLAGLCTAPAFRRNGFAQALLLYAMGQLSPQYIALLMATDIPDFYYRFGFCHCYQLRRHILSAALSAAISPLWRQSALSEPDLEQCDRIYRRMTARLDGYVIRGHANWRNFLTDFLCDGGGLYVANDAYLLWIIEDGMLKIKELGFTSRAALQRGVVLGRQIAADRDSPGIIWDAPLAVPAPAGALLRPHVMAVSCAALQACTDAEEIAAQTKKLFGSSPKLWVNEIT